RVAGRGRGGFPGPGCLAPAVGAVRDLPPERLRGARPLLPLARPRAGAPAPEPARARAGPAARPGASAWPDVPGRLRRVVAAFGRLLPRNTLTDGCPGRGRLAPLPHREPATPA